MFQRTGSFGPSSLPLLLMGGLAVVAALTTLALPETKGQPLEDRTTTTTSQIEDKLEEESFIY